jgi:hypothetical protein
MPNRDDFRVGVVRKLAHRAGHRCSNPRCRAATSGPQHNATGTANVGKAAHITAAAPGGPRYNPNLTPEQRRSVDNGIWLCGTCATLIDTDPTFFTEELLRAWRTLTEIEAHNSLGRASGLPGLPNLELHLEIEGITGGYYSATNPTRRFILGIKNAPSAGLAKFPGIRFKTTSGLLVDHFGIDGNYNFGLPQSPTDHESLAFKGGSDHVIHPSELVKIAKLHQNGVNQGLGGMSATRRADLYRPDGSTRLARWLFSPVEFEYELTAEGMALIAGKKSFPEDAVEWRT